LEGTLEEALEQIGREMEVDIYPDWDGALADEQIDKDIPVRVELPYATVSAKTLLELLLDPLELGYLVRDGIIYLTTHLALEEEEDFLEFRVYNVRDLRKGDTDTEEFMNLVRFVNDAAWEDDDGYGGNVQWHDGMLAVRQTQKVHGQIEDIFAKLSEADQEHAWGPERSEFKKATKKAGTLTGNVSIEQKLQQPLGIRALEASSMREALGLISHKLKVDIFPDWDGALADEAIDGDIPVSVELEHTTVSAVTFLELVLKPMRLAYVIRDGCIHVTTQIASEEEDEFLEFRVYNVRDLLRQDTDTDEFMKLVQFANDAAWQDEVLYGGSVQWHDGMLAVHQTQQVHRQIVRIFEQLRAVDKEHRWGPERPQFKKAKKKARTPPPSGGGCESF